MQALQAARTTSADTGQPEFGLYDASAVYRNSSAKNYTSSQHQKQKRQEKKIQNVHLIEERLPRKGPFKIILGQRNKKSTKGSHLLRNAQSRESRMLRPLFSYDSSACEQESTSKPRRWIRWILPTVSSLERRA